MRLLLAMTVVALSQIAVAAEDADAMLRQVYQASSTVQRLEAEFEQTKELKAFAQPVTYTGTLIYERNGPIVWRYESPDRMEFVMDGSVARMRYPDLGEEQEFDLAADERVRPLVESMTVWLGGSPEQVQAAYEVTVEPGRERTLALTPRDELLRGFIQRMVLSYGDDGLVTEIRMEEPDGDSATYRFQNNRIDRIE